MVEVARAVAEDGMTEIPPFDHPAVVAGQGTLGLEIVADCPDVDTVLVPLSGGGLAAGVALAVKALRPDARVIGVTMENGAAMAASLRAGRPVEVAEIASLADSLGGGIGLGNRVTFALCRTLLDDVVLVSEGEIAAGPAPSRRRGPRRRGRGRCRHRRPAVGQDRAARPDRHHPVGRKHRPRPARPHHGRRGAGMRPPVTILTESDLRCVDAAGSCGGRLHRGRLCRAGDATGRDAAGPAAGYSRTPGRGRCEDRPCPRSGPFRDQDQPRISSTTRRWGCHRPTA